MKPLRLLSALLLGGAGAHAHAACEQPPLVLIPAAEELEGEEGEVIEATEEYFQAMLEYVNCIRTELESAGDEASDLYKSMMVQRNNLAVAEAEAVQRWFNSRFPSRATGAPSPTE
jgi:hypothetical protein